MEQLCVWGGTILRVILAGMIAVTPGVLGWLAMLGIWLAFRRVSGGDAYKRFRHAGPKTQSPTAISH